MARVESILNEAKIPHEAVYFDTIGTNSTVRMRFADTDTQLKAKDTLQRALSPDAEDPAYIVALNLISNTPRWLVSLNALPMYLGLDLRGGVHFLLQVDMRGDRQAARYADIGHPDTVAREEYPSRGINKTRRRSISAFATRKCARARRTCCARKSRNWRCARPVKGTICAGRDTDTGRAKSDSGFRTPAEHFDVA